jgi:hypothetical protein
LLRSRRFWTFWFPWLLFQTCNGANLFAGWWHASADTKDTLSSLATMAIGAAFARSLEDWIDERLAKRKRRST